MFKDAKIMLLTAEAFYGEDLSSTVNLAVFITFQDLKFFLNVNR